MGVYLVLVFGLAGWCGKDFWSVQNILLVVLPPCAGALAWSIVHWRRQGTSGPKIVGLIMSAANLLIGAMIGGMTMIGALRFAHMAGGHWPNPFVRAAVGAVSVGLLLAALWLVYRPEKSRADQSELGGAGAPTKT